MVKINLEIEANDLKELLNKGDLSMVLEDKVREKVYDKKDLCTHKYNGIVKLTKQTETTNRCSLCGKIFEIMDNSDKDIKVIEESMLVINNMFESIKTLGLTLSDDTIKEIAILQKQINDLPDLLKDTNNKFNIFADEKFKPRQNQEGFDMLHTITKPINPWNRF